MLVKKFTKFFVYLVMFSFLWSCCHRIPPIENPYTSLPTSLQSYIYIRNNIVDSNTSMEVGEISGTGGVIVYNKSKYILTAAHVCYPQLFGPPELINENLFNLQNVLTIFDYQGKEISGQIISFDIKKDICLIKPTENISGGIKLSKKEPQIGDKIKIMAGPYGYHAEGVIPIFDGYFSGYDPSGWAIFSIHIGPGSSGGLLLNEDNQLVGVISAGYVFDMNIAIGSGLTEIKEFISSSE